MKLVKTLICSLLVICSVMPVAAKKAKKKAASKPKVWIISDMTDKTLPGPNRAGTLTDPDDISAMAAYLLLSNNFDTRGIVVASTQRQALKETPDQGEWANNYFLPAYRQDIKLLNQKVGGYQEDISFVESCLKSRAERFNPDKNYSDLSNYSTIEALRDLAMESKEPIYVSCWGPVSEPAILVKHALDTDNTDFLSRLIFVAHWTNSPHHQGTPETPEKVANCTDDRKACAYMKDMAAKGVVPYYECGAIGQFGIVKGSPRGDDYFNKFHKSGLGKIFATGRYIFKSVDFSDAAAYVVLLGKWGVTLDDINSDGTNPAELELENEAKFQATSKDLHNELLRLSNIAAGVE